MADREVILAAVQRTLWNASNYPPKVQPHLLGQDIGPLSAAVTDAVMFALITDPGPEGQGSIETAEQVVTDALTRSHVPSNVLLNLQAYRRMVAENVVGALVGAGLLTQKPEGQGA